MTKKFLQTLIINNLSNSNLFGVFNINFFKICLDKILNKKEFLILFLYLFSNFTIISQSHSQDLSISDYEYYLDDSKLYNTNLPIEQNLSRESREKIKLYVPEDYYQANQTYYQQNFDNRNKFIKKPEPKIETLAKTPPPKVEKKIKPPAIKSQYREPTKTELRTAGNYLGIDFINTSLQYREISLATQDTTVLSSYNKTNYNKPDNKNSFGFKYMYAINYKGVFLAPEIFYEYNNTTNYLLPDVTSTLDTRAYQSFGYKYTKIHYRYGAKINLGYDINPDFAPYIFGGIARIRHSNLASIYPGRERYDIISAINEDPLQIYKKYSLVPFFGFGGKIKLSPHFYLSSEYSIFEFLSKTKSKKFFNYDSPNIPENNRADQVDIEQNVRIFKVGIMYNF